MTQQQNAKPHKHADVIKAWADGATIQFLNPCRGIERSVEPKWTDYTSDTGPSWLDHVQYRVKPIPHKWQKEMDAFAAGKKIQYRFIGSGSGWFSVTKTPSWSSSCEYRLEPEQMVKRLKASINIAGTLSLVNSIESNLKLTFEDGVLISAEVIKK